MNLHCDRHACWRAVLGEVVDDVVDVGQISEDRGAVDGLTTSQQCAVSGIVVETDQVPPGILTRHSQQVATGHMEPVRQHVVLYNQQQRAGFLKDQFRTAHVIWTFGEHGARAYNGSVKAEPQQASRGRPHCASRGGGGKAS